MAMVFSLLVFFCRLITSSGIGVNYGRIGNNLPPPATVAQFVKSQNIATVRIFDADPSIIQAFAAQNIPIAITLGNGDIPSVAASQAAADSWVSANVLPFKSTVSLVVVGNEVLKYNPEFASQLVPAMVNIQNSVTNIGGAAIKVSTAHAMDILDPSSSFPPSAGFFKSEYSGAVFQPALDFLARTGSVFLLNAYPFFAYRDDKGVNLKLDYALLQPGAAGFNDPNTGLHYTNLLDAQLDTVYSAIRKLNHDDVAIVLSESGWPSEGESAASPENAGIYNRNLVQRVGAGLGTPLKPATPVQAFIFALFNENQKPSVTEQNFGLFRADMSKVYDINF